MITTHRERTDFRAYEATPGISVMVLPDAPVYTHVAVSNDFIKATGLSREEVIGKGHFEVFPKSPDDPNFTGEQNLKASFAYIIQHKVPHEIPVQRYDIANADGTFFQKYWRINNAPVLDDEGEVQFIVHSAVDITDQVLAEEREESVKGIKKAYNFFMNAPVIIGFVRGRDYVIELANEVLLEVWGRSGEVVGKPLFEAIPELQGQGFRELLDNVRTTGEPFYAYEHPISLNRYGREEVLYFDFVYKPYYEEGGEREASGVISVGHDVTAKVLARKEVAEVSERLNFRMALFEAQNEATPDGVLIVDPNGRMLLHNSRFIDIWKIPPEIIENKDDEAALRHAMKMVVDPKGFRDRVSYLYQRSKEKSYDEILFKDGRIIERRGTPIIAENGHYYGWAWYFRDVTERIRQEQKFRNVIQQAPNPILIMKGEDMVLEVANEALFRIWQVDESAIGKPFLEILPEMKEQGFLELLRKVYHTGEPFHGVEVPAVFEEANGQQRTVYFNFTYQPYHEINGAITGVLIMATDVTGQVKAKQSLVESERNLRSTILQSPVAMCILRGGLFVVEVANDRMFELWGKKKSEVINKPIFDGLPETKGQGLEELLQHVYSTGEAFSASERQVQLLRNGLLETVCINFVYQPLIDGNGAVSGVIAVAIDVTEQVLARRKLEESELELQQRVKERTADLEHQKALVESILDASMSGVMALDAIRNDKGEVVDFSIIKVNEKLGEITGLDETVVGESYLKHFTSSAANGIFDMYKEVLEKGKPQRKEIFSTNLNLNSWFDISAAPRGEQGIVVNFANISQQRQAAIQIEQQKNLLDSILSNSPSGITVYSAIRDAENKVVDFQCILANDAAETFTQIPNKERLEKTVLEITPDLKESPLFLMAVNAVEKGESFRTQYHRREIGKWLELSVVKMHENHLINVFNDITSTKEAQLRLEESIKSLKQKNEELEQFTYVSHHDLQEPLRKIALFTDMIKTEAAEKLSEASQSRLEKVTDAAKRMSSALRDVLNFASLDKEEQFVEVDLDEVVAAVEVDLEHVVAEKGAKIYTEALPTLKVVPQQMHQLFYNLINNALKFSRGDQPPLINIRCKRLEKEALMEHPELDQNGRYFLITIQDNGIGFHQDAAERIFGLFQRLHNRQAFAGTGIGLALCRKVVQNHNGKIWAESKEGAGAIFRIILPLTGENPVG